MSAISLASFLESLANDLPLPQSITIVDTGDINLSSVDIEIKRDLVIHFLPLHELCCRRIVVNGCRAEIHRLHLTGAIHVVNGFLELFNSVVHDAGDSIDYLLSIQRSRVFVGKSSFFGSRHFGIAVDSQSTLDFVNSELRNVALFGLLVTAHSRLKAVRSKFCHIGSDALWITTGCEARIIACEFQHLERRGCTLNHAAFVEFEQCHLSEAGLTYLFASSCSQLLIRDCHFFNCRHTIIYLERTCAVVKHTLIEKGDGNGINISHDSQCLLSSSVIRDTKFPPIAICESSSAYVRKCVITNSQMCGLIIRTNSRSCIENCIIRDVKLFGISISDSKDVTVRHTIVQNCAHSALACYNHSVARLSGVNLITSRFGVNVFTGGRAVVHDTTIAGMQEAAVWMHHAGSGSFSQVVMNSCEVPPGATSDEIGQLISVAGEGPTADTFLNIESGRLVEVQYSVALGIGAISRCEGIRDPVPFGNEALPARCKVCAGDASQAMFKRCGHAIYCRRCWDALEVKDEVCELCLMPADGVVAPINCSHEGEEGTCSICFAQPTDTVVLPCGHMTCWECACTWFASSSDCPFCRGRASRPQRLVSYV
jgi:hypothetical protein